MRNISDKKLQRTSKHTFYNNAFTTDGNIIWCMCFASWITKATNSHLECVIVTVFPWQQWLHKHASILCYTYTACLVNLNLEYTIKSIQYNQERLKCSGIFQLLACADNVNLLCESVKTIKQSTEALLFASKQVGPVPNTVKTKYVFMPH